MSQPPPIDAPADRAKTYDWDTVLNCGLALLLQSAWDGQPVCELLARATGPATDPEAYAELYAYVRRTLEPMKGGGSLVATAPLDEPH